MASERLTYKTLFKKENIEIREYNAAVFATVRSEGEIFKNRSKNFRKLAGYIFGGNSNSEQISMTSPVTMKQEADTSVMSFMIPSEWSINELPKPNNEDIKFNSQEGFYAVTITFGGYSDSEKYAKYHQELVEFCQKHNLDYSEDSYLLGYDPPFKVMGRRNEVLIKLNRLPDEWPE